MDRLLTIYETNELGECVLCEVKSTSTYQLLHSYEKLMKEYTLEAYSDYRDAAIVLSKAQHVDSPEEICQRPLVRVDITMSFTNSAGFEEERAFAYILEVYSYLIGEYYPIQS